MLQYIIKCIKVKTNRLKQMKKLITLITINKKSLLALPSAQIISGLETTSVHPLRKCFTHIYSIANIFANNRLSTERVAIYQINKVSKIKTQNILLKTFVLSVFLYKRINLMS